MKRVLILIASLALGTMTGCSKLDRFLGDEDKPQINTPLPTADADLFRSVACCRDLNGGTPTYPSFLPQHHIDFCERVRSANRMDLPIDGLYYLATGSNCGRGHKDVGDEYYPPTGY